MVIHYMYLEDLFFKKTIMIYLFIYFYWLRHRAQPCEVRLVPHPGFEPVPLHWKHRVLTTALPGKSLFILMIGKCVFTSHYTLKSLVYMGYKCKCEINNFKMLKDNYLYKLEAGKVFEN